MSADSFGARSTLEVSADATYEIYPPRRAPGRASTSPGCRSRSRSCSRTCLRNEDGATVTADDVGRSHAGTPRPSPARRSPSSRRACCCRTSPASRPSSTSPRCATRWRARRRPGEDQPARPGRTGHRPLRPGRRVRHRRRRSRVNAELEFERNRERYAFLRWGQDGVQQLPGRPAGHRHRPPGEPRVPRARRLLDDATATARPTPTRWSAPTRTRRWSTASACSAGASAASRPRRRCSASRCRC